MFTALSTSAAFLPTVLTAITLSRKPLMAFPVRGHNSSRSNVKVNVQSHNSHVNNATKDDVLLDLFSGRFVDKKDFVFRQYFRIRSYEVGGDRRASIETLMNLLQEAGNNYVKGAELLSDGLALSVTKKLSKRNLVWVVVKMQVIVDHYPMWQDVVEVDTWTGMSGKNAMRREWLVRDSNSGDILAQATSLWVLMNTNTRKLAKISDEIREDLKCCVGTSPPIMDIDSRKIPKLDAKTAHFIRTGLTPCLNDLDMVKHVNNVKYISWIIESVPLQILETHKLVGMSLEYRKECTSDSVVQSLTSIVNNGSDDFTECQHLLYFEDGEEIAKGKTKWERKSLAGL